MTDPESGPATAPGPRARRRRTFAPVVLLGLASAALAAVGSAKPWYGTGATTSTSDASMAALDTGSRYPVASAVSLVLLAAWGVLLVTRGVVRRGFAVLAVVAAVGLVVAVVAGHATLPDTAGSSYDQLLGRGGARPRFTGWFWTAAVASVVALVPAALAVRLTPAWPEMGSRYDAPGNPGTAGSGAVVAGDSGPASDQDLWRSLDEGEDPTDPYRG